MSDDRWRPRDPDDFSEYGSLFDEAEPTNTLPAVPGRPAPTVGPHDDSYGDGIDVGEADRFEQRVEQIAADPTPPPLSFGEGSGPLPHWTEKPTGEVPSLGGAADEIEEGADDMFDDDVDVWSSFSSESPVWKDDVDDAPPAFREPAPTAQQAAVSGRHPVTERTARTERVTGQQRRVDPDGDDRPRTPSRITIGTDPAGMPRNEPPAGARSGGASGRRRAPAARPGPSRARPASRPGAKPEASKSGRDMPTAIAVGMLLAALFIAALMWRPWVAAAFIALVLTLGAVEFYAKVSEKGYRPAVIPGVAATAAIPLSAYWLGELAIPLALAFGFLAVAGSFIGARSVEAGPLPNVSITTLGVVWIGLLGAFAMLILRLSTSNGTALDGSDHWGTDTLFLVALGVVANDTGALFVGSAAGRTPLRPWISPNKTVEGFIGGALLTIIALIVVGIGAWSTTWTSYTDLLLLAVVISVLAPMGDLVESMFKRNLDVKDFGSIIKGHGGILDRFDGFLFVLPAVYYLTLVLKPWEVV